MAEILIIEADARYRHLMRYILEGINHRVLEAADLDDLPLLLAGGRPDLAILGIHLSGEDPWEWEAWRRLPSDIPALMLFSGDLARREEFLEAWDNTGVFKVMEQPVEPYPLLAMVKAMLTQPAEWLRGGQHSF